MELQRAGVRVEPTYDAAPAGLGHENLLHPAPPIADRLGVAAGAAIPAGRADPDEGTSAVDRAFRQDLLRRVFVTAGIVGGLRLEFVPLQPVPHSRGTD